MALDCLTCDEVPRVISHVLKPRAVQLNWSSGRPGWGQSQPLVHLGVVDATKAPFFADPTGANDSTAALQGEQCRLVADAQTRCAVAAAKLTQWSPRAATGCNMSPLTYRASSHAAAVDAGREHYLTVYLPSGRYTVSGTINLKQPAKMCVRREAATPTFFSASIAG